MKKFTLFATLTLCILLLAGCSEKPQKPSGNTEQPTIGTQSENTELASLRSSKIDEFRDAELTQNDLQQFYGRLKVNGRKIRTEVYGNGLSDRMVRGCHAICRKGLQKAVEDGLIRMNPAIGCKLPPKKAREMQVLSREEMQRFIVQAKADGYFELFILELSTGLRRGEIAGLQWGDLDVQTGELHISRQATTVHGNIHISTPKTESSIRTIILPPDIVKILAEYKKKIN